jgi:phosphatidate cytidylyltransferase
MLKKRVLTALCLVPLVIAAILWLSTVAFVLLSSAVFLVAAWEWSRFAGFETLLGRMGCVLLMVLMATLLLIALERLGSRTSLQAGVLVFIPAFWVMAFIAVICYPNYALFWKSPIIGVWSGCMVLVPTWAFFIALQYTDPYMLLYIVALVCVCDSAAYIVGKRYGCTKLVPALSPGKTWEGVLGGLALGFVVVGVAYVLLKPKLSVPHWMLLSFITMIFSIVGDLFESLFKRLRNLKDSGAILPGHGGILDRLDSINAAVPLFSLGTMFLS